MLPIVSFSRDEKDSTPPLPNPSPPHEPSEVNLFVVCPNIPCTVPDCPLLHHSDSICVINSVPIPRGESYTRECLRRGVDAGILWVTSHHIENFDPALWQLPRVNLSLQHKINARQQRCVLTMLHEEYGTRARVVSIKKFANAFLWSFDGMCPHHEWVHGSNHWTITMFENNDTYCLFHCFHGDVKRKIMHLPLDWWVEWLKKLIFVMKRSFVSRTLFFFNQITAGSGRCQCIQPKRRSWSGTWSCSRQFEPRHSQHSREQ